MEPRKLIKFGNSSYVITLPTEWIKKNSLEKGQTIKINEHDNSLILSVPKEEIEKVATLSLDLPLKIFNRELISYYLKNYKKIIIKDKNILEKLDEIKVLKEKLSSLEIVEISPNSVVLRDLISPNELEVSKLIKDIVEIEKVLFDELIKKDPSKKHFFISGLDSNVNKLSFLCYKALNYNLDSWIKPQQAKDVVHYWRIVSSLEQSGDIIKRIARYIKERDSMQIHFLTPVLEDVKTYFIFITSLLEKNINLNKNLQLQLDRKLSLLKEFETMRDQFKENINLYLVLTQLLKDLLGQLDNIVLSIIDLNCKK